MMTVWPSGVTTTVLAERRSMTGAKTLVEIWTVAVDRLEICGRDNHFHQAVRRDERRDLQNDADILISDRADRNAGGAFDNVTPVTSGTDWPTVIVAGWLLRTRMEGRDNTSTFCAEAMARTVAVKSLPTIE